MGWGVRQDQADRNCGSYSYSGSASASASGSVSASSSASVSASDSVSASGSDSVSDLVLGLGLRDLLFRE
jgi:hypothetical protein